MSLNQTEPSFGVGDSPNGDEELRSRLQDMAHNDEAAQQQFRLQREAPAPWLAAHNAQAQRNLLSAKMAESQALDQHARMSAERDFEGTKASLPAPSRDRRREGRKTERENPMAFSSILRGQMMAIGCSLVSSLSDVHGSNADRQRMGHLTDMIDGSLAQKIQTKIKANLYGTDAETFFRRYDPDRSGAYDFEELRVLIRKTLKIPAHEISDPDIHALLRALDDDGSGDLDIKELAKFITTGKTGAQLDASAAGGGTDPSSSAPSETEAAADGPGRGAAEVLHMSTKWSESVFVSIFGAYAGEDGKMGLQQWTWFLEDADALRTYCPRDARGNLDVNFRRRLSPEVLFRGDSGRAHGLKKGNTQNPTRLTFNEFFNRLIELARILCEAASDGNVNGRGAAAAGAGENDPAAAEAEGQEEKIGNLEANYSPSAAVLSRFLYDTILPLFTWIEGKHAKCGSQDPITADTRILLLVQAYLPNLWHLFLSYAAPREGKEQCSTLSSHVSSEFPDAAKRNELMLCGPDDTGMGPLAHLPPLDTAETAGRVPLPLMVVHEASAIRCAKEFGFIPDILSVQQVRAIFRRSASGRSSTEATASPGAPSSAVGAATSPNSPPPPPALSSPKSKSPKKSPSPTKHPAVVTSTTKAVRNRNLAKLGRKSPGSLRGAPTSDAQNLDATQRSAADDGATVGGSTIQSRGDETQQETGPTAHELDLGFCSFAEFICRVSAVGLSQKRYSMLYPTPFSRVTAGLIGPWSFANPAKIKAAVFLHRDPPETGP
jgi:hypothetical protein